MKRSVPLTVLVWLIAGLFSPAIAQQRIGYFDSDRVLERMPEYQTMQQELNRLISQRQQEVDEVYGEVEALRTEFAAQELLLTEDERDRRLEAIRAAEQEADALRRRYFGAEGEVFQEQQQRLEPIQARIIEAVTELAEEQNYDYIFDRSGDYLFLYAKADYDVTEEIMDKLGIGVGAGITTAPAGEDQPSPEEAETPTPDVPLEPGEVNVPEP